MSDEDDYFRKLDQEARAKLAAKLAGEQAVNEKAARRALHFNKCGKCGGDMRTEVFRGIEIEICNECSAVLLDPGELEQLAGQDSTGVLTSFFTMFGGGKKG